MSCCDRFVMTESQDEFKMWQGLVGAHYTPYVDGAGNLSWTNNGELPNPPTVNINGRGLTITGVVATTGDLPETAAQYDTYLVGSNEEYYAYMYVNGTWTNMGLMGRGEQGEPGFSPVVTVSPITGGHQISITDAEDTETFNVMDGQDGQDGQDGVGVPTGGSTGQVLAKASGTDYDTEWVDQSGGGGTVQSVNNVSPDQTGNITLTADDIGTDATNISIQDALDDYVYVGTSAPTDPTTKIWLDTDEPGMSAVSSVNGATGTVVLDADDVGAIECDLVWSNASPTSNFASQSVPLNLSAFDFALFVLTESTNSPTRKIVFLARIGDEVTFATVLSASTTIAMARRVTTVGSSSVSFGDGQHEQAGASLTTSNERLVPYQIYGIKGVQTS